MEGLRLQLYDVLVSFFVGTIAATAVLLSPLGHLVTPYAAKIQAIGEGYPGVALLTFAYTLGHLIQLAARQVFSIALVRRLIGSPKVEAWRTLSVEEQQAIQTGLMEFYGFRTVDTTRIEILCMAPVHERLAKRDMFVALADFNRSLCLISSMLAIVYLGLILLDELFMQRLAFMLILGLVSFLTAKGYKVYTMHSVSFVLGSFMSWWKQQNARLP